MQQILIIVPVALAALLFAYYKYLVSPLKVKQKMLAEELATIENDYQDSVSKAARLPQMQQEIVLLDAEVQKIQKRLPISQDLAELIRMLAKKMDEHHVVWMSLSPGTEVSMEHYTEHSYTIPFQTSYHNLAQFLADVGQMERIFATRFTDLTAQPNSQTGAIAVSGQLTFLIYTGKS